MLSKYDPLSRYLRNRPLVEREHLLSFEEIEKLLGIGLPNSARHNRPWWANTISSPQARHWMEAGWKVGKVDLISKRITFARLIAGVTGKPRPIRNRYGNLPLFFNTISERQNQIALSFAEMGMLIGDKLPSTAFCDRPWWANTKSSPQGKAWMKAGWRVEKVFLKANIVTFRRKGSNLLQYISRYINGLLDNSPSLGHPDPRTLASWIRTGKRHNWYYEATLLYERGGAYLDSLDEAERAELEEDYGVCKRELLQYKDVLLSMSKGKSNV